MKKIAIIVLSFFILSLFLPASLGYAKKYSYKHTYRYYRYDYESFRPLIWVGAIYIGIIGAKELIFIPQERIMKEKEIQLIDLEIQKKKKEIEFLYSPPRGWKRTPRGKKLLKKLNQEYFFFEE